MYMTRRLFERTRPSIAAGEQAEVGEEAAVGRVADQRRRPDVGLDGADRRTCRADRYRQPPG